MKTIIVTYSFSGNNARLAKSLAEKSNADLTEVREFRRRNIPTIVMDTLLNRSPKIQDLQTEIRDYDHVIFVAPIWFGKVASPFRQVFHQCRNELKRYSFVSISGGANGIRPSVEKELRRRTGKKPYNLSHYLISDFLPDHQKGDQKVLNHYKLKNEEASELSERIIKELFTATNN